MLPYSLYTTYMSANARIQKLTAKISRLAFRLSSRAAIALLLFWPSAAVRAQGTGGSQPPAASSTTPFQTYSLSNPLKAGTAPELIGRFVSMFIGVAGSFALLMFIYGGLVLLTSRGNPEQVQKGKNIFIWATIGLVVIFTSYIVLRNVFQIIGAND